MKLSRGDFTFFWHGPFSQWAIYPIEIDSVIYNCNEQYMMSEKARLFGDEEILERIMNASHPKTQKSLGRTVRCFDKNVWEANCREIVYMANLAKFTQHKNLKSILLNTGKTIIVEASPYDKIWGIGMPDTHPDVCDPTKWKGANWLGEAIMRVRKEIFETMTDLSRKEND